VRTTCVLFVVWFNNFAPTMGFYWSYMLLLKSPVLTHSWDCLSHPSFRCLLYKIFLRGRQSGFTIQSRAWSTKM